MSIKSHQIFCNDISTLGAKLSDNSLIPGLILLFGSYSMLEKLAETGIIRSHFPCVPVAGCTTAGEIHGTQISDDSVVINLISFENTIVVEKSVSIETVSDSTQIGVTLANSFEKEGLQHLFVLTDGLNINGSKFVEGLRNMLPDEVAVTGGLAGDGPRFQKTGVFDSSGFSDKKTVAIGFYGSSIKVGYGSLGGWDSFGPERTITKSEGNILYEIDDKPALTLYKQYLGEMAKDLPAAGLLFPLTIKIPGAAEPLVRTLLSIDEEKNSLVFAGDVPQGCLSRLMKANLSRLLDGASDAANIASIRLSDKKAEVAILISCVGRRLVLKQRAEDELDSVQEQLGNSSLITGFYSYGEIAPFMANARCELHNQTMTITALLEE